jgi:acetyl esterase/lipase
LALLAALLAACTPTPTGATSAESSVGPATSTAAATPAPAAADAKDVVYKAGLALDFYAVPRPGTHPLIVSIHGGGWREGDKSECLPERLGFPARGYAVACVNYRLSGQAIFPAQIEDVRDAIAYLRANAVRFGVDPRRFVAWGPSAGGHLVALAGTTSRTAVFTMDGNASAVQAVIDYFGPIDLTAMATTPGYFAHQSADSAPSELLGGPVLQRPDQARQANPVTYLDPADPPVLIVHGTADPVSPVAQSYLFRDALKAAGVTVELHVIDGAKHGGPEFSTPSVVNLVLAFLAANLPPAT